MIAFVKTWLKTSSHSWGGRGRTFKSCRSDQEFSGFADYANPLLCLFISCLLEVSLMFLHIL